MFTFVHSNVGVGLGLGNMVAGLFHNVYTYLFISVYVYLCVCMYIYVYPGRLMYTGAYLCRSGTGTRQRGGGAVRWYGRQRHDWSISYLHQNRWVWHCGVLCCRCVAGVLQVCSTDWESVICIKVGGYCIVLQVCCRYVTGVLQVCCSVLHCVALCCRCVAVYCTDWAECRLN